MAVMADSYKATHFQQYPAASKMVAYGEFRTGFQRDQEDNRIVVFGVRFIVEKLLMKKWSMDDVTRAEAFYKAHRAPDHEEYPFPKELFTKFVQENNGYFPIRFEALADGTCVHAHVPVYQITAEGCYSTLCTFLETLITMIWYPCTVATLARRVRDTIEASFHETSDLGVDHPLIPSRLHDFGFRGCTTMDQAIVGGCAHLLSFAGTDTMPAAYYAQFYLNSGKAVASSIPATEHSVMTAWSSEKEAILKMVEFYGTGLFSCVMDSYDYINALENVLPSIASEKVGKGGFMVLRPDSGDPSEAVIQALKAADRVFGMDINQKGYRVLRGCGVIQGDGMTPDKITQVLQEMQKEGYSAENCAFGMGGGLLQKINRDTMSFATKLNHITYASGVERDIMKSPKSDTGKFSLPGELAVKRVDGIPMVLPKDCIHNPDENLLRVVYDCGPVKTESMESGDFWEDFDGIRQRVLTEWKSLPRSYDPISALLGEKISSLKQSKLSS